MLDEISRLASLAGHYEILWRRATEGAASANKAVRRLKAKVWRLKDSLTLAQAEIERLQHEVREQEKKLERLSLRILKLWEGE